MRSSAGGGLESKKNNSSKTKDDVSSVLKKVEDFDELDKIPRTEQ